MNKKTILTDKTSSSNHTEHADPKFPRDAAGRIIKRGPCDVCGYGNLQYEGDGFWLCDGLAAPEWDDDSLIECPRYHQDGQTPYKVKSLERSNTGAKRLLADKGKT